MPYSIWQLVEHIRIAQYDILDLSRNADYVALKWPDEYWPTETAPATPEDWQNALLQIKKDRDEFVALLNNSEADLYTSFPHGDGQNLLREALLIADHTSYHTGQIIVLRRLLNEWKG